MSRRAGGGPGWRGPVGRGTIDLGGIDVTPILAGRFRLDGGAVFGVVPRALWEGPCPPDARNRIPMVCNCLLVRTAEHVVLVETGCGDRLDDRVRDIFAVDPEVTLLRALAAAGVEPAAVTRVVLTHLHFDHASGALVERAGGLQATFPDAVHVVQRGEWEDARAGRSIMRSSYLSADLAALESLATWQWAVGDLEVVPGVELRVTGGHTAHHQAVLVRGRQGTVAYLGDLIPTRHHLRPYWIMAYDMHPYDTFVRKQELAKRACEGGWLVAWDHDPQAPFSRLVAGDRDLIAIDAPAPAPP